MPNISNPNAVYAKDMQEGPIYTSTPVGEFWKSKGKYFWKNGYGEIAEINPEPHGLFYELKRVEDDTDEALNDFNYVGSSHHY